MLIATTPAPPYWAVVFSSQRTAGDAEGYRRMAEAMAELAPSQEGFLGIESARDAEGFGITVSYWRDEACIAAWKRQAAHVAAQRAGHSRWYADFAVRVARVERAYTLADSPRAGL
ncbi:MAG: antibiotic biosynthesis monooxygenase [Candidatus Eisenbacteria bacterium]|uniref:Antibiotic biosynthesis monooxygenase n=1 Tax=Eiseniibacteriota bacterium TaxID=2212470 RepID=A0A933W2P0_UNCEI|nr:antibiotic biosynthesis monooxygenase [Candidatus Eisenbacteria bacterium]